MSLDIERERCLMLEEVFPQMQTGQVKSGQTGLYAMAAAHLLLPKAICAYR